MSLLEGMGYRIVRDYSGGLEDWKRRGGPTVQEGPRRTEGVRRERWLDALNRVLDSVSTRQIVLASVAVVIGCALIYWSGSRAGVQDYALFSGGRPVPSGAAGFVTALYFSLVTFTTLGYGDVQPMGWMRFVAVGEAATGLLVFGAVISKLLTRRQEILTVEIHRLTFEDRLGRVQSNLHTILSDLQALSVLCQAGQLSPPRIRTRMESVVLVFASELRTIHDLLYRPQQDPGVDRLKSILAGLGVSFEELIVALKCMPRGVTAKSQATPDTQTALQPSPARLDSSLLGLARLGQEICADCVPRTYEASLSAWLDGTREHAQSLERIVMVTDR